MKAETEVVRRLGGCWRTTVFRRIANSSFSLEFSGFSHLNHGFRTYLNPRKIRPEA